jgi:hypothetical protein
MNILFKHSDGRALRYLHVSFFHFLRQCLDLHEGLSEGDCILVFMICLNDQ